METEVAYVHRNFRFTGVKAMGNTALLEAAIIKVCTASVTSDVLSDHFRIDSICSFAVSTLSFVLCDTTPLSVILSS